MKSNLHSGFSILELMIAIMLLTTTLCAIVLATFELPRSIANGHMRAIATNLAYANLEKEFGIGKNSYASVGTQSTTTSSIYNSSVSVVTLPDGLTKLLTSFVTWINAKNQPESISLQGLLTDPADATTNLCSSVLSGNWKNPFVKTFTQPGHPIQALAVASSTLAATVTNAMNATDPTVFIFDISSSTNPIIEGSLDNATTTKVGFASLALNGSLLYGASAYGPNFDSCKTGPACSQLQILSIADPAHPSVITNFQLSTTTLTRAVGMGGQSAGKSIFYQNGLVYLGLQKVNNPMGQEFNIINVQNPHVPIWLGGYSVKRTLNQIIISNGEAYLATDDPNNELLTLTVQNSSKPSLQGSYNAPGNTAFGFGEALSLSGKGLVFGRSYTTDAPEFGIFSAAPSSTPVFVGPTKSSESAESIQSILLRGPLLFILTASSLEIWNVVDPINPTPFTTSLSLPNASTASSTGALVCKNNTLYVASFDAANNGYLTAITGS